MAVLQDININVHGQPSEKRLQTFLRLSQNENGRMINFRVLGPPLPSNCTATFSGTKPDGNVYSKTGTVTGNFVVIEEDIQMTAVAGVWDAKLDIINGTHNIMTALIRVVVDADVVDPDAIASDSQLQGLVAETKYYAEHARTDAYGSPLTAPTKAQMTDHTRVYVYTGSEPNMVAGNWYHWNGTEWISGGVYNAVAVQTDTTLSVAGKAADGKATGDAVASLKEDLNAELDQLRSATSNLCNVSTGRFYIDASGNIGPSPTENYVGMSEAIPANAEENYIISFFGLTVSTTSRMYWAFYASDGTIVGSRQSVNRAGTNVHYTVPVPEGASKLCACMYNSSGINADAGIMVSHGSSNPTEYLPPYTGMDKAARAAVNALDGEMAIKRKGLISQATVTAEGWTNLIDLPDEYAYGIGAGITIDGKPPKLASASFTLMKFKVRNTVDYGVYLAVGRGVAYYALVYTSDTTPKWIEIGNPEKDEDDHTLGLRWGTTAQIVLLGDSIVQGVGSSDYSATGDTIVTIDGTEFKRNVGVKSWGAQFKEKVESDYYGLTVVNNGLPGKGIHVITANLDSLVTSSTKYAIVCAGVNNRNSGATTIQDYYIALFEALQAKGINVLCLSPIDKNGATGNTSLAMINTACERACNTCGVPYYNLYGEYNAVLNANTKADYYNDQLHPNDKGYATMFGIICKLLNL